MNLADLRLRIAVETDGITEWLSLKLEDEMNLLEVALDCPIALDSLNPQYLLEELMVTGTRCLIREAITKGLISVPRGGSTNSDVNSLAAVHTPTRANNSSQFLAESESL